MQMVLLKILRKLQWSYNLYQSSLQNLRYCSHLHFRSGLNQKSSQNIVHLEVEGLVPFFFNHNRAFLNIAGRKTLGQATFLNVLNYGDDIYMHDASSILHCHHSLYNSSLCFVINLLSSTYLVLYNLVPSDVCNSRYFL